jgi:uncharacterized protein YndB with AHSA1/START domain
MKSQPITVETTVKKSLDHVWEKWTLPEHVKEWNNASADWHTPEAESDLRVGGYFCYKMSAKDGSFSFDFDGVYDEVVEKKRIFYTLSDGRKVLVDFIDAGGEVKIVETFDAETENSLEMQRAGWQAILDNFKKYAESGY